MPIRRIEIYGAKEIAAAMRKASIDMEARMGEPHRTTAARAAGAARGYAPRRSGGLAGSIFSRGDRRQGEFGATTAYAGVIHFGTPQTVGRPSNISANTFGYSGYNSTEAANLLDWEQWLRRVVVIPVEASS